MSRTESERRGHRRHGVGCTVCVVTEGGSRQSRGRTLNISNGGMLVTIPADTVPGLRQEVHTCVAVPRTTSNTHILEDFELDATVVRHHAMQDANLVAVALRFCSAADLNMEA